jgi:hypothetical protein
MSNDDILKQRALDTAERLKELHNGKTFHEFQLKVFNAIFRDGIKRIFIRKGRKGGGTETALYPLARIAGTIPNSACYIIGPTQKLQAEIIWHNRRLHNFLPPEWGATPHEQEKRIRLNNGSFIKVEGADNPDAARGWLGDIFIWDELKDHNPLSLEACYPNVLPRDAVWIVLGSPPTKKTNHYYILEQNIKNDPDWAFFHWSSWDNPFLPGGHDFLSSERKKYYGRGAGDIWEIEYEAKYVFNARRKVLPNFTDKNKKPRSVLRSLIQRDQSRLRWVASIDPGYATCFAVLFACFNPYTNELFILDEIYSRNREDNSARDMYPLIKTKQDRLFKGKWDTIYDEAALGFAVEIRAIAKDKRETFNLTPTRKHKTDEDTYFRVANGIFAVDGQCFIAEECSHTIEEMENYETDDKDNYPDKDNHNLDNLRYILKYLGITPILKQFSNKLPISERKGYTMEEDFENARQSNDVAGFGGVNASFGIGDLDV